MPNESQTALLAALLALAFASSAYSQTIEAEDGVRLYGLTEVGPGAQSIQLVKAVHKCPGGWETALVFGMVEDGPSYPGEERFRLCTRAPSASGASDEIPDVHVEVVQKQRLLTLLREQRPTEGASHE